MSSCEPAARLLWDPGQWSSSDPDLVSAMSSLAIASSFPEDLAATKSQSDFISPTSHHLVSASTSHGTEHVFFVVRKFPNHSQNFYFVQL